MKGPEARLEDLLVDECLSKGWIPIKWGLHGWPDRMILLPRGGVAFVELKAPRGVFMHRQYARAKQLIELGHVVLMLKGTVKGWTWKRLTLKDCSRGMNEKS